MANLDPLTSALDLLGKKHRRLGAGLMAQCPSHDDGKPSLAITPKDDKIVLHCFAGCQPDQILNDLNLTWADLFDQPLPPVDDLSRYILDTTPATTTVADTHPIEYIYRDYDGNTIAKKVRYIDHDGKKTFRQYRYHDNQWLPGLNGLDLPLYNSDLIGLAAANNLPVYIVEGEKDADTVTALGEIAVTMPNGAGSWNDRYTTQLAAITDIRIIIDRDEPGINHAIAVKQALDTPGRTITTLMPMDGCKDITDHINASHAFTDLIDADQQTAAKIEETKKAKLQQLIDEELLKQQARNEAKRQIGNSEAAGRYALPGYEPTLTAELDKTDEPLRWLINGLWPEDANISLTAPFKGGKTTTANSVIKALADGQPLFGNPDYNIGDPGRIAIWNYEVSPNQYRHWLREANIRNTDKIVVLNMRGHTWPIIHQYVIDHTIQWLAHNNITTWIIDPLARAFVGCGDENSNADMGVFCDTLDYIKDQAAVRNLLVIAHTGRNSESGISRARGASRFDDWADARWTLTKDPHTGNRYFSADGRDVSIEESYLEWFETDRSQKIHTGIGRKRIIIEETAQRVYDIIKNAGLNGINRSGIITAYKAAYGEESLSNESADTGILAKLQNDYLVEKYKVGNSWIFRAINGQLAVTD